MKTKKKIEIEATERKCDFCDVASIYFHGLTNSCNVDVCGLQSIRQCCVCNKDICEKHSHAFWDNYVDDTGYDHYSSITTCLQCKPIVEKIWEEEKGKDECAEYEGRLVCAVNERLDATRAASEISTKNNKEQP